ncbi:MAG: T9SS type A sorting domain-containing protein [Candidatus Symbiothrix sp.]|jgi:hypothetical protein|nr:T9SS type A sorting domain-containing protein [Candidatus Symbiothrix sp.]
MKYLSSLFFFLFFSTVLSLNAQIKVETNGRVYSLASMTEKEKTEIRYLLPAEVQSAEIYVFDMQGRQLKKLPANKSGSIEIKGSDLQAGMYLYTLVVDGKQVDTKRMILTK